MVLNYDCLRDVLISLESNLSIDEDLKFERFNLEDILKFKELENYSHEDIYYCIYNLFEINFVEGLLKFADGGIPYICLIQNITYSGHEFLQSIKSNSVWEDIKSKIKPFAGLSIPIIQEVAASVIYSKLGIK